MDYSPFLPEPHIPFSRLVFWAVVSVVGVGIWGALALDGRVGSGDALAQTCAEATLPESARVVRHDEVARTITFAWNDAQEETVTLPYDPERVFEGCSMSAKRVLARAYREENAAGGAMRLPRALRRPERMTPLAQECPKPETSGGVVTIRLRGNVQKGKCVALHAEQRLMFVNDTNFPETIHLLSREPFPEFPVTQTMLPRATSSIPFAVGEYLAAGVHEFIGGPSSIPEVYVLP